MEPRTDIKSGQIGSFILELRPLVAVKACVQHGHQHNSFSFNRGNPETCR